MGAAVCGVRRRGQATRGSVAENDVKSYGANASESPARRATSPPAGLCLQAMLHREVRSRLSIQGPGTRGCSRDTGRGSCYLG